MRYSIVSKEITTDQVVAERKLRCQPPRYEPGGGGINVSRAIGRLGGDSLAIYTAGGNTGELLQSLLEGEDLHHRAVEIEQMTRQSVMVLEESSGRQFRFSVPGPALREEEWQEALEVLSGIRPAPSYIAASGSLPPEVPEDLYARVARMARDLDARLILDTHGPPLRSAIEEGFFLLKPNMRELRELAGGDLEDETQQEAAARELIEKDQVRVVIVSLGAAGALLVTEDGCRRLRAPTVPIRSRVGAGDSMVAGIVLALDRGRTIFEAARFGVAAGSAAVQTPGTELCRREDAEALYERMISDAETDRGEEEEHARRKEN